MKILLILYTVVSTLTISVVCTTNTRSTTSTTKSKQTPSQGSSKRKNSPIRHFQNKLHETDVMSELFLKNDTNYHSLKQEIVNNTEFVDTTRTDSTDGLDIVNNNTKPDITSNVTPLYPTDKPHDRNTFLNKSKDFKNSKNTNSKMKYSETDGLDDTAIDTMNTTDLKLSDANTVDAISKHTKRDGIKLRTNVTSEVEGHWLGIREELNETDNGQNVTRSDLYNSTYRRYVNASLSLDPYSYYDDLPPRLGNVSSEQRLMSDLLWKYESSVRPIYNSSMPVEVGLGLTLTQILDLDEKNQVLTTNVWMEVEWKDEKLIWNSSDYDGIDNIRVPCRRLWLPDIVLYNSVEDYTSGYMPSLAMVYSNGRVFWGPVVRFRSSCKIDITYFPFDDQVCYLKLGSWAYNGFQVNVFKRSNSIDLSNYVDNGEWKLIGVKVTRNSVVYNCCEEPFPDVMFYVRLRRRVKYYFMNIIIPCIILSFLCLAGFLLPPESGEKVTLGLSVLLTITVFMLMVADKMPQTSESVSLISIYLMVVLSMSCASILFSVYILSIHHQRGKPLKCPKLIKYIAFSIIAPALCLKLRSSGHVITKNRKTQDRRQNGDTYFEERQEIIQLSGLSERVNIQEDYSKVINADSNLNDLDPILKHYRDKESSVNELIQWLYRKQNMESLEDKSFQEWRDLAFVLDRLLFVVFLVINVASTAFILSLRPEQSLSGFSEIDRQH